MRRIRKLLIPIIGVCEVWQFTAYLVNAITIGNPRNYHVFILWGLCILLFMVDPSDKPTLDEQKNEVNQVKLKI